MVRILHLSDIHFGRNNPTYNIQGQFEKKNVILQGIIDAVSKMEKKPDHIIMTGDIAWYGKKEEFEEALEWFKQLLSVTGLSEKDITMCPGNHDVNRGYVNFDCSMIDNKKTIEELDELYKYDHIHEIEAPLENYNWFCYQLGITPFDYPVDEEFCSSYCVGYKDITILNEVFRVFSFNTALFSSIGEYPDDRNLIGRPQIMDLRKYGLMGKEDRNYCIAIFHHAERFLHPDEISEYNERTASLPLLRENVDLVLCGHTETGGKPVLYHQDEGAYMLTAGAAYYDDLHPNAFSLIDIERDDRRPRVTPYIFDGIVWRIYCDGRCDKELVQIERQPILGEMKGSGSFSFISGKDIYSIPISKLRLYSSDGRRAKGDNKGDPARLLDIKVEGPLISPGEATFNIDVAPERAYSVEAMLAREKAFHFLHLHAGQRTMFRMDNEKGQTFFSGEVKKSKTNLDTDEISIEFLENLRMIEERLDIRFSCPEDLYDEDVRNTEQIKNLLLQEYLILQKEYVVRTASVMIHEKAMLAGLLKQAKKENVFYLICRDDFEGYLVGRSFSMGMYHVLTGPYKVNVEDLQYKVKTFVNGDERQIVFECTPSTKTILHTNSEKVKSVKEISGTFSGAPVLINDMKLNLGFIREKHRG